MTVGADEFLTTTEIAKHLKCGRDTVLRAIDAGDLRAIRRGRLVRVRRSDFDAWLAGMTTGDQLAPRRRRRSRYPA
jgi:excisionase family DNA binding protein